MASQTHYQTLMVAENASREVIDASYKRLLTDAKEKLQDTPLFTERSENLKHAHQILFNQMTRQAYDRKLAQMRTRDNSTAYTETSNVAEFFGNLVFSKAFLGAVVLIIVLVILIPSGKDRVGQNVVNKQLNNAYDIEQQHMALARQKEERYMLTQEYNDNWKERDQERRAATEQKRLEMEERRLAMQEQREMERIEREDRLLAIKEKREARNLEYEMERKKDRERRERKYKQHQDELDAKRRSQEFIRSVERTGELQRDTYRLESGY